MCACKECTRLVITKQGEKGDKGDSAILEWQEFDITGAPFYRIIGTFKSVGYYIKSSDATSVVFTLPQNPEVGEVIEVAFFTNISNIRFQPFEAIAEVDVKSSTGLITALGPLNAIGWNNNSPDDMTGSTFKLTCVESTASSIRWLVTRHNMTTDASSFIL